MVEGLRTSAQLHPPDNRTRRLLPHVLEATAHAQRLRAVPDRAVRLLTTVGNNLRAAGQLDTSRPVLDRALAIAQAQLGPEHSDTLAARGNLARWLGAAGQPGQAAAQLRDLLDDFLRVLGPDHPDTLTGRGNLARWLGEAGQPGQAAAQFRDLLTDFLRVLGPDHPDTLTTRGNLANWLGAAGQPGQAAPSSATCSKTSCGCWDPTTPTLSPPAPTWPIGRIGRRWAEAEFPECLVLTRRRAEYAILGAGTLRESLRERTTR